MSSKDIFEYKYSISNFLFKNNFNDILWILRMKKKKSFRMERFIGLLKSEISIRRCKIRFKTLS